MGGHCVVTRNGPAYYLGTTEMVEDGPAGGRVFFFDDELEQLHGGVRQASSGFDDKEDGQVLWVLCEVSEDRPIPSLFVRGPDLLDPGDARSGLNGDAVRVAHRSRAASSRRSEKRVVSDGGKTRGSLERTDRMEVWRQLGADR